MSMDWTKARFVKAYLISAGIILLITGLGKFPLYSVVSIICEGEPIWNIGLPFAPTYMALGGFACGVELAIVILICFSPVRWLPCLASAVWGFLCLLFRLLFMTPDGPSNCRCLGWLEAPPGVVALIAGWLAAGGGITFWWAWKGIRSRECSSSQYGLATRTGAGVILLCVAIGTLGWGLRRVLNGANYREQWFGEQVGNPFFYGPIGLAIASPAIAIGTVMAIRGVFLIRGAIRWNSSAS